MKRFILFLFLTMLGCGSKNMTESANIPKWVKEQPDLCGIGINKNRGSLGTDRTLANAKARVDLSKKLETKVKSMIKLYEASGEEDSKSFTEELSRAVSVNLSKTVINGSNPKQFDYDENYVYSLVCLNPDVLTNAIDQMNNLSEAQRRALSRRAQKAHEELEEQINKY